MTVRGGSWGWRAPYRIDRVQARAEHLQNQPPLSFVSARMNESQPGTKDLGMLQLPRRGHAAASSRVTRRRRAIVRSRCIHSAAEFATIAVGALPSAPPAVRWQTLRDLVSVPSRIVEGDRRRVAREGWGSASSPAAGHEGTWARGKSRPPCGIVHHGSWSSSMGSGSRATRRRSPLSV
jgi:hypothetical protein